jgi:hypothetical protein
VKFAAGDPIWARIELNAREFRGVVIKYQPVLSQLSLSCHGEIYSVDVPGIPLPPGFIEQAFCVCCLRPRRDDYQQREGLGSRANLVTPLADDPVIIPEPNEVSA